LAAVFCAGTWRARLTHRHITVSLAIHIIISPDFRIPSYDH
jgi:hypothetical protein